MLYYERDRIGRLPVERRLGPLGGSGEKVEQRPVRVDCLDVEGGDQFAVGGDGRS
jgi:hypothetical protein